MKEKVKEFLISYLPGFITSLIVCGGVSVLAMTYFPSNQTTYDNKTSGLNSTNVQGAIDELYNVCTAEPPAGEQIIENAGLGKNEYECRYFFTGANPNNYITFNNEKAGWRIISIGCDNTIKIMREVSIGNIAWDTSQNNNWNRLATLNTYLNGEYYNSLTSTAKNQIVPSNYSIGRVTYDNNDLADQINDENSETWNGKIALVTVSEFLKTNSDKSKCGTFDLNNGFSSCKNANWMVTSSINYWWTLSPYHSGSMFVYGVDINGNIISTTAGSPGIAVRPALYLSSKVRITGGTGTQSDPYTIE